MHEHQNMMDSYEHVDKQVMYVDENIPGPRENSEDYVKITNGFSSQLSPCECKDLCLHETCHCLLRSGGPNYSLYMLKNKPQFRLNAKSYPVIECNSLCQCSETCNNRYVQRGPVEGLIICLSKNEHKGLGLFTRNFIPKGTFICEYAGEVISKSQALMRHVANRIEGKMNYIYCLNEHSNGKIEQTFVDPSMFGNIGRYINHSCEPNGQIIPVRVDMPIPKLAIFSSIDISAGAEITFDYGTFNMKDLSSKNLDQKQCLCGSSKCVRLMPFDIY